MKKQERLFFALNGVDEELLDRCNAPRSRRAPIIWFAAAAACAAALALVLFLAPHGTHEPVASVSLPPTGTVSPAPSITVSPSPAAIPSIPPSEEEFHLLQLSAQETGAGLDFTLYLNSDLYRGAEEDGVYIIRPVTPPMEGLPDCQMEIAHCDTGPEETARNLSDQMSADWTVEPTEQFHIEDGLSLHAHKGLDWDSATCDIYIVSDGQGGCFTLSAFYFMEATEGHGVRFADMAATFQVPSATSSEPQWLAQLKDTVSLLTPALFSRDFSEVEDLLSPDALLWGYDSDVSDYVSIRSVDYTVDDNQSPQTAVVWIKHHFGGEESYSFLTLQLHYSDQWYLDAEAVEK